MPITIIDAPPACTSPEQHRQLTSATPDSFDSIPPVLRHKEDGVLLNLDPPLEGVTSENAQGTLYVTEKCVKMINYVHGCGLLAVLTRFP